MYLSCLSPPLLLLLVPRPLLRLVLLSERLDHVEDDDDVDGDDGEDGRGDGGHRGLELVVLQQLLGAEEDTERQEEHEEAVEEETQQRVIGSFLLRCCAEESFPRLGGWCRRVGVTRLLRSLLWLEESFEVIQFISRFGSVLHFCRSGITFIVVI